MASSLPVQRWTDDALCAQVARQARALDKACAVEDLAWVLVVAGKDGVLVFGRFAVPGERCTSGKGRRT